MTTSRGASSSGAVAPLPGRRLPRVLTEFLETEAAGGIVLVVAAVGALVWANSPLQDSYARLWHSVLEIRVAGHGLGLSLHGWVNDGLMAVFFFVVGLEIKREVVRGELRDPRRAALPAIAAVGGMAVPALVYVVVNGAGAGSHGWGIPMATDIAFALGVVALLGSRVPPSLKLFLLTLAIVDDIGAIVVIAVFYTPSIDVGAVGVAIALLSAMVALRRLDVRWLPLYVVLAVGVWLAVHQSGIHATIAGVVLGLMCPTAPLTPASTAREWAADLAQEPSPAELADMTRLARTSVSLADRLEHRLHPVSSFVIVPLFALANAGVPLGRHALSPPGTAKVAAGVAIGLVLGKLAGISGASWLAVRLRVGVLPEGAGWLQVVGIAAVSGIGFTVSLFVSELAFGATAGTSTQESPLTVAAKVGVLAGSLLAALVGLAVLAAAHRRPRPPRTVAS